MTVLDHRRARRSNHPALLIAALSRLPVVRRGSREQLINVETSEFLLQLAHLTLERPPEIAFVDVELRGEDGPNPGHPGVLPIAHEAPQMERTTTRGGDRDPPPLHRGY